MNNQSDPPASIKRRSLLKSALKWSALPVALPLHQLHQLWPKPLAAEAASSHHQAAQQVLELFKNASTLEYGPLFAYDADNRLRVSAGIQFSAVWKNPSEILAEQGMMLDDDKILRFNQVLTPANEAWLRQIPELNSFLDRVQQRTRVNHGQPGVYRVGFGSCMRTITDNDQTLFKLASEMNLDAFMILGDFIYNDAPGTDFDNYQIDKKYLRQLKIPNFRQCFQNLPLYTIWDDHDYWSNNKDSTNVSVKDRKWSRKLFSQTMPNPAFGENDEGIYYKWTLGDIDFFMLDTRWFRNKERQVMLGEQQNQWLRRELLTSKASFKLLASGVPWNANSGSDGWARYIAERDALLNFIAKNNVQGVFLLAGDIHQAQAYELSPPAFKDTRYRLVEFASSGLAVPPNHSELAENPEMKPLLNLKGEKNFGLLEFYTEVPWKFVDLKVMRHHLHPAPWLDTKFFHRIYASELSV